MSQTSRSRILAAQRHRRGLARVIASLELGAPVEDIGVLGCAKFIMEGASTFDVHRAREYAEELKALEVEQAVFEDWTRARGKGPEASKMPGLFIGPRCEVCERARVYSGPCHYDDCGAAESECYVTDGGWPGKLAREWPGDPRAPMGRSLARLGRRLFEVLEGQLDECENCTGRTFVIHSRERGSDVHKTSECRVCHGTGHNLAGVLPPIEWSPAVRREVLDAYNQRHRDQRPVPRP